VKKRSWDLYFKNRIIGESDINEKTDNHDVEG